MEIKIRAAAPQDAPALLMIYAPYVKNTAITFEYEVPSENEFAERIRRTLLQYPYIVAEYDERIVGYGYVSRFHDREAYDWTVETSVYVASDVRGTGIGSALYKKMEEILSQMHIINLEACIAYTDTEDETLTNDSMRFHESIGYHLVGKFSRCGYKFDRWYDMIWMEKSIGEHLVPMPKALRFDEVRGQFGL